MVVHFVTCLVSYLTIGLGQNFKPGHSYTVRRGREDGVRKGKADHPQGQRASCDLYRKTMQRRKNDVFLQTPSRYTVALEQRFFWSCSPAGRENRPVTISGFPAHIDRPRYARIG